LVRATLGELPDNVEIVEWDMSGPAPLARADMVIPPYLQSLEVLRSLEVSTSDWCRVSRSATTASPIPASAHDVRERRLGT